MLSSLYRTGFGLYIHWPFCQSKCPYCDFNSHVAKAVDHKRWQDAMVSEIKRHAAATPNHLLETVFFGGGTPSLMDPDTVGAVIETARASWPSANNVEITLEANPTSVEAAKLKSFRDSGVNRVSVGVQALNDPDLRMLGRKHSAAEACRAVEIARSTFERVSFDLIYSRQGQSREAWETELRTAIDMNVDHLSLYQLTIEDGTVFAERSLRGQLHGLPDEDLSADLYEVTQQLCGEAGLFGYETSSHARQGSESRHNLIYWRCGDYIGIGPGAHGRITVGGDRYATAAVSNPQLWLDRDLAGVDIVQECEKLTSYDQFIELVMMGLRLAEGVPLARLKDFGEFSISEKRIDILQEAGFVAVENKRIAVTAKGRPLLNSILRDLLASPA